MTQNHPHQSSQDPRDELLKLITEAQAKGNTGEVRRLAIWLFHADGKHLCEENNPKQQDS